MTTNFQYRVVNVSIRYRGKVALSNKNKKKPNVRLSKTRNFVV